MSHSATPGQILISRGKDDELVNITNYWYTNKMRRNILVTGATGKQGQALIRAILHPAIPDTENEYHIYAFTRHSGGSGVLDLFELVGSDNITIVEGDLEDRSSISAAFEKGSANGGIWGVFAVIPFQGLDVSADGEERQGKTLADIALEFQVSVFVYSSSLTTGLKYEDNLHLKPTGLAKQNIELHCMELGEKKLPWIILKPGFFMENFDGFLGSIAEGVLKSGLNKDTTVGLIASEDIGNVAAGVFRNHEKYLKKVAVLVSEFSTMSQLEDSYRRAANKAIPTIPGALSWTILKMNKTTQHLIKELEQSHNARASGDYDKVHEEIALANSAYKMKTFYEWVQQGKSGKDQPKNWNQVSLWKLVTGKL